MRNLVLSAENIRDNMSALNAAKSFDRNALLAELRTSSDIRATQFYNTIPIVAAWKTVQKVADKEGYAFRTPSLNPRNPRNAPTPKESQILSALALGQLQEYFDVDREENEIIYARPIRLGSIAEASSGVGDVNRQVAESSIVTRSIAMEVSEVDRAAGLMAKGGQHVESSASRLSSIAATLKSSVQSFRI